MGSVVSYLHYVYMENPEEKSLTTMMVYAGRIVATMTVRRRCPSWDTWGKMETIWRGVSDRYNDYAGRTIESVMVRRR